MLVWTEPLSWLFEMSNSQMVDDTVVLLVELEAALPLFHQNDPHEGEAGECAILCVRLMCSSAASTTGARLLLVRDPVLSHVLLPWVANPLIPLSVSSSEIGPSLPGHTSCQENLCISGGSPFPFRHAWSIKNNPI